MKEREAPNLAATDTAKVKTVLDAAVKMVEGSDLIGLDLETTGLNPRTAKLRLVQVSNGVETYVLDLWKDVDATPLFEALSQKTVVAHGGDFEWQWIYHNYGVELQDVRDTLLMARLVAAGEMSISCGLGAVAERDLGIKLDKEMQEPTGWAAERLSDRRLNYAAKDAQVLLPLYAKLLGELTHLGLDRVAAIENAALPSVARMKLEGMPVDKGAWDQHAGAVEANLRALERRMLEAEWMPQPEPIRQTWALQGDDCLAMLHAAGLEGVTGTAAKNLKKYEEHEIVRNLLAYRKAKGEERENLKAAVLEHAPDKPAAPPAPWNFGSTEQVKDIIFELTGEDLESTSEVELLKRLDQHEFFSLLLERRKLAKRVSTYGKGWFKEAYDEERARVHPGWRQIGSSTGRFASGEKDVAPNAQNLPNDGPYRSFFVAPAGRVFVDMDYSQIEVRIIAKMLGEKSLLGLFERGADVYRSTAAGLLDIEEEGVTYEQRRLAKALVLGMLYGLSAFGLPQYAFKNYGVKMTPGQAKEYVEAFYTLYPKIKTYHDDTQAELYKEGSIDRRTATGRLRAGITNRNEAINAPIQGLAADGLKAAMALVYRRLRKFNGTAFIIASIHDELLVECDEADGEEVAKIVKEAMLEAMDGIVNAEGDPVPIEVSGGVTKVWTKDS
jgi:DNA polymerase I-like protein with 3'-5' exonuclease and polymerase domains